MPTFDETIAPFMLAEHETSTSLLMCEVGRYKQAIFNERADDGFQGSGYDWQSLAEVFLHEKYPELKDVIRMNSECDMFCAYAKDKAAIKDFAIAFHTLCENEAEMRDALSRAELD